MDVCGTTTDLDDPRSWWMPTEAESDAWKRRERSLYYTVWTFYVERVTFGSVGVTIVQGRKAAFITLNPEQVRAFVARLTKAAGK